MASAKNLNVQHVEKSIPFSWNAIFFRINAKADILQSLVPSYNAKVVSNHVVGRCKCGKCLAIFKSLFNKMQLDSLKPHDATFGLNKISRKI